MKSRIIDVMHGDCVARLDEGNHPVYNLPPRKHQTMALRHSLGTVVGHTGGIELPHIALNGSHAVLDKPKLGNVTHIVVGKPSAEWMPHDPRFPHAWCEILFVKIRRSLILHNIAFSCSNSMWFRISRPKAAGAATADSAAWDDELQDGQFSCREYLPARVLLRGRGRWLVIYNLCYVMYITFITIILPGEVSPFASSAFSASEKLLPVVVTWSSSLGAENETAVPSAYMKAFALAALA